jgi:hypothetical protein
MSDRIEPLFDSRCEVCEGAGWDWKRAADEDLQVDDPVDYYWCERCEGKGRHV